MRRIIALLLAVLIALPPLAADTIDFEYEPYTEEEFPIWSHELRRAESIFFGSLVITFPVAMGVYSLASMMGMPGPSEEYQQVLIQAGIAAGLSLIIADTDWILGKVGN